VPYDQYRTEDIERRVAKLEKDVIHGNGLPGLTTRMAMGENRMENIEQKQKSIALQFWAIIILLMSTLTAVIVDLTVRH
jgi:hypothetical protein